MTSSGTFDLDRSAPTAAEWYEVSRKRAVRCHGSGELACQQDPHLLSSWASTRPTSPWSRCVGPPSTPAPPVPGCVRWRPGATRRPTALHRTGQKMDFEAWATQQRVLCLRNSAVAFGYASDKRTGVAGDPDTAGPVAEDGCVQDVAGQHANR